MKTKLFGCLLPALAMLANVPSAFASRNAYLHMTGERSGLVKGSVTQAGRQDSIMVIAYSHDISIPFDALGGLPKGKAKHNVLMITKVVDKSSPILYRMLVNNERTKDFRLDFWIPSASGVEIQYYTIKLTNARIVSIKAEMLNNKYPENMQHYEYEQISFAYDTITWTYQDGGITTSANWSGASISR